MPDQYFAVLTNARSVGVQGDGRSYSDTVALRAVSTDDFMTAAWARLPHKVIDFMPGQSDEINKGGTLRLGAWPCVITPGTTLAACYGQDRISERHRHRYELNNDYRSALEAAGMTLCGRSPDDLLIEAVELTEHPFYVGVQYHPEFKSRPNKPHPLFLGFVKAALKQLSD